jgi:phosphate transport system substrate-binding protein
MGSLAKAVSLSVLWCFASTETGVAASGEANIPAIRISGAQTMTGLTRRLTEWYAGRNQGVEFHLEGSTPTQGFTALIENKAEIAQSTRKALDGEIGALRSRRKLEFVEIPVATEFAVIAVNAANPVHAISAYDLRLILSGQVKNWKQVGGKDAAIHLLGRDRNSDVRNLIDEEFMGDASFSGAIKEFPTNAAALAAVAGDVNALAFCDVDLHPQRGVRLVGIKASTTGEAIEPTGENIRAHKYTLSRTLYFCFAGPPAPELTRFTAWVLSPEGQLVVEAVGLYPLGSADREGARLKLEGNRSLSLNR